MKTFRENYCERHGLQPQAFERVLVWRSLHWQARPFFWLRWIFPDYYAPDFEFVRAVGGLRSRQGYREEAAEFHYHPGNRGFLRTVLGIRVSSHRLQTIFERELSTAVSAGSLRPHGEI
jgi:hypothetical protein